MTLRARIGLGLLVCVWFVISVFTGSPKEEEKGWW